MSVKRRTVVKGGALAAVGMAGVGVPLGQSLQTKSASKLASSKMPRPYAATFVEPPTLRPYKITTDEDGIATKHYTLTERESTAQIVPGINTRLWTYNGIFPGPTIEVEQGELAEVRVRNQLPATHPLFGHEFQTSVHLHGSATLPQYDGYANDLTPPGFYKVYKYPNFQNARSIWYHDHKVHHTALNVYTGLAANYVIHDAIERRLLPQGQFDVHATLSDAMFGADGQLSYDDNSHSGMWGDVILVNGRPWPAMKVKRRIYRFRFLNASLSRSYNPRLSNGDTMYVVGTDGGLVPTTLPVKNWRHGMAERYEILIDFRKYTPGTRVQLLNGSNPNNRDYDNTGKIMAFDVVGDAFDTSDPTWNTIPSSLYPEHETMTLTESQSVKGRYLRLERENGLWAINGKTWHEVIESGFTYVEADPGLGDVEIWEIENKSGGWFHPLHIHLIDFKVLTRNGVAPFDWERGPKDVVYIGENEKVRVMMRFGPHRGKYMVHCHNLPHEDNDMMTQFSVGLKPEDVDDNDPIRADPCKVDDLTDPQT